MTLQSTQQSIQQLTTLRPVSGVTLGWAEAGIRKSNRKDLLVIQLDEGSRVAGVFTSNRFCAAPVQICKAHLALQNQSSIKKEISGIRALVINTGNANAGTGQAGLAHAHQTCEALARLLHIAPEQILPFSTGVILESLPIERLIQGLPQALSNLSAEHWHSAAEAIMTTDTRPKAASRTLTLDNQTITITGISKGEGMIHPNMATMLGFIATDAHISQELLNKLVQEAADRSFNCISVDGDTSTNDSFILIATGQSKTEEISSTQDHRYETLRKALIEISQELAQLIVRDGEGATKFITITVEQGQSLEECRAIAFAIAHSPLVKTAFYASDPNLGRILAAIGNAPVPDLDVSLIQLYLGNIWVAKNGERHPDYEEADGQRAMQPQDITVRVQLGRGHTQATIWTCDLSQDYVSINADYRS